MNKKTTWLIIVCFIATVLMLSSCKSAVEEGVAPIQMDYSGSIEVGGLTRTYKIHLPTGYDGKKSFPLVLAFHLGYMQGRDMERLTHLSETADKEGVIVVYPDGYKRCWAGPGLVNPAQIEGVDDVAFVSALLDKMIDKLRVDQKRVYAVGICNGGFLVQMLGCRLYDRLAAVAVAATAINIEFIEWCQVKGRLPIMFFHGTEDTYILWEGGRGQSGRVTLMPVRTAVEKWAEINGCSSTPSISYMPDKADDGTRVRREVYPGCQDGTEVVLYLVEGGGHTWPGGWQYIEEKTIGRTCRDIDASQLIWDFFEKHPKK